MYRLYSDGKVIRTFDSHRTIEIIRSGNETKTFINGTLARKVTRYKSDDSLISVIEIENYKKKQIYRKYVDSHKSDDTDKEYTCYEGFDKV